VYYVAQFVASQQGNQNKMNFEDWEEDHHNEMVDLWKESGTNKSYINWVIEFYQDNRVD